MGRNTAKPRSCSMKQHSDLLDIYYASFHPTHEGQYQMYLALAATLPAGWH